MITLFHILPIAGLLLGAAIGAQVGHAAFGSAGGVLGGVVGAVAGVAMGRIPWLMALRSLSRDLTAKSTAELRDYLHSPDCLTPNVVLLELQRRGEDLRQELPFVLNLLVSDDTARRAHGWVALTSAFPDLVAKARDYRITDSVDECRRKTELLRNLT